MSSQPEKKDSNSYPSELSALRQQVEQYAAQLQVINSIQEGLVSELNFQAIIDLVGNKVQEIFNVSEVEIALYNTETRMISIPFWSTQEGQVHAEPLPLGTGMMSHIIQTREPFFLSDENREWVSQKAAVPAGLQERKSFIGAPIISGDEVIGAISLHEATEENAYDESDLRLLTTIANNMAVALKNARLFDDVQKRNQEISEALEQQAATSEVLRALSGFQPDLRSLLEIIAVNAAKVCGADDAHIYRIEHEALKEWTHRGPIPGLEAGESLPLNRDSVIGRAIVDRRTIHIRDAAVELGETDYPISAPLQRRWGYRTSLCIPLLRDGEPLGGIAIRRKEVQPFTEKQIELIKTFADQAVIAIENVRLFDEVQKRNAEITEALERETASNDILRVIAQSPMDIQPVLDAIVRNAAQLSGADDAIIGIVDGETLRVAAHYGDIPMIPIGEGIRFNRDSVAGRAIIEGRPLQAIHNQPGVKSEYLEGDKVAEKYGYRVTCAVPLMREGKAIGAISIRRIKPDLLNGKQIELVQSFANQAAIAVENVRLFNEVRSQRQFLEAVIANSPAAIALIGRDAIIRGWNLAAEKLFGYTEAEALGCNIDDLIAYREEVRSEAINYTQQALTENRFHIITKRVRKDGTFIDVEISALPINPANLNQGFVVIYHDITEVQRARQEAIAANEAKSAFLATMSHEIRTPMNAVIGMSGLLMDTDLTREQLEYAETIRNSSDTLLTIINDILDFSKIEAGKMELENQPFDLRECIESALDLVAGRAVERRLDLAYLIDDEVPSVVRGDVTRVRQILLNLLSNGIKFTDHGEVIVEVKQGQAKNTLLFTVRDTGIGISPEGMTRLFQSFSQADSSTTRQYGGTGLGLAISKRLTEMMGGTMWTESQGVRGKGSTFFFTIKAETAKSLVRKSARNLSGLQPEVEGKRILIVDDNATNCRILKLQTKKWGMTSQVTQSPKQALEILKTGGKFDLAILDMHMPEMDGIALAKALRKLPIAKKLPLILLTSLGRQEINAKASEFSSHLTKPIKPSQLFDALASVFVTTQTKKRKATSTKTGKLKLDPKMAKRHPLRILLAEDNVVNQKVALRILEQIGYRADVASNGLEAIESVERQRYDVILMDVQMPEMDGLEATRRIVARWARKKRPHIVAMTANAMQGDRETCLAAGMNDYITKPIRVDELIGALNKVAPQIQEK